MLKAGYPAGAYYLAGYAVECALKACIAKQTKRGDFPPKIADNYYTHDLTKLLKTAGLESQKNIDAKALTDLDKNFGLVARWKAINRYMPVSQPEARDLIEAITKRKQGVLPWLKKKW